jgi:hypothetical protein
MPPAGFEPTASGLGILRSILLSYGGSRNISYLQLRFSHSVSNCSPLCLTVSNEVSKSLIVAYLLNFRKETCMPSNCGTRLRFPPSHEPSLEIAPAVPAIDR